MKPVLNWMKSHLAIVVLSAVIILVLPLGFIGSAYWNGKIRKSREAAAAKSLNDLNALKVSYTLPSPLPGGTPVVRDADVPNPRLTEFFRQKRQELEGQVGQIVNIAEEVNLRRPLMAGVFPTPADQTKTLEMAYLVVGREGQPSVYEQLLERINADGPTDHAALAQSLMEARQQAQEKLLADTGRQQATAEESEALQKELAARRMAAYQQHARDISVYATTDCLPRDVPRTLPSESPDIGACFRWQWDYWVIEDLLTAVARANSRDGTPTPVTNSVVKRIESIALAPLDFTPPDPENPSAGISSSASVTGRASGGGNGLYDLREASLSLIVSSSRIPELINAISSTNFMTVTGLSIEDVDEWAELENGYFYGPEHVVRVRLSVETIWLRSWTIRYMAPQIREIVTGQPLAADAPPPPPPPEPAPRPATSGKSKSKSKR